MPTYDYTCTGCGHKLEALQKITEAPLTTCPACRKDLLSRGPGGGIGIALTGDGFYKTMYNPTSPSADSKSSSGCCPCGKNKNNCSSNG